MPHYRAIGRLPKKRHTQMRTEEGVLYTEELMGEEGFSSDASLLYHVNSPTAIVRSEPVATGPGGKLVENHPLQPRHFRTHDLDEGGDIVSGRHLVTGNDEVRLYYASVKEASDLYRNSTGDELVYVEAGEATVETVFGVLDVGQGDYVLLPAGTTHRWLPRGEDNLRTLIVEARGHIRPPRRYLSDSGQFLEHAPYCERDLRAPEEPLIADDEEATVLVRHRAGLTRITYEHHPFDVVGWDGCLYPYVFNIADFEPVVGRVHMPPPAHQTFEGPGFVVCSFCPRPFDFDENAVPVPYSHSNVDSDEVLFYVGGDFMSRRNAGIVQGSISLHPAGWAHGPHPGAAEASLGAERTDEWAVMVDTFRPLALGTAGLEVEATDYAWSWSSAAHV